MAKGDTSTPVSALILDDAMDESDLTSCITLLPEAAEIFGGLPGQKSRVANYIELQVHTINPSK